MKECPNVNVHLEYRRTGQVYEDIQGNAVDLGLVPFPERDAKVKTVVFRKEPLVLVCHPRHPLAKLKMVNLKALHGMKMVGFERSTLTRKALDRMLNDKGVKVEYVMEFDNIDTVKRAVEIDAGVAILPEDTVRSEVADKTLMAVRLDGQYFRPLAVVYRKSKVLTPATRRFIELLKEPL
jgi:DNA-binding transcriptional LysR family regulator